MNKAPPVEKLRGAVFGAPVPDTYHQFCSNIGLFAFPDFTTILMHSWSYLRSFYTLTFSGMSIWLFSLKSLLLQMQTAIKLLKMLQYW
jgi:hypothetical protein